MKFTRIHWFLICILTTVSTLVFEMIAQMVKSALLFYVIAGVCGLYAVFSLYKVITVQKHRIYNETEDEALYKAACIHCGEPLAGHELTCPSCGAFLPTKSDSQE